MLSLPTVQELVARQVQIQDDIESGEIAHDVGMTYIRNISLIISGTETAEQMAKEEPSSEEEVPVEPTFADDALIDEDSVRRAMVGIYGQVELGKISPATGAARIKALEAIAKTFKNSAPVVEVNINAEGDPEAEKKISEVVEGIENRLRNDGEDKDFLIKELSLIHSLPRHEVAKAMHDRRSFMDTKISGKRK